MQSERPLLPSGPDGVCKSTFHGPWRCECAAGSQGLQDQTPCQGLERVPALLSGAQTVPARPIGCSWDFALVPVRKERQDIRLTFRDGFPSRFQAPSIRRDGSKESNWNRWQVGFRVEKGCRIGQNWNPVGRKQVGGGLDDIQGSSLPGELELEGSAHI
jgi:hypothetical protein